MSPTQLDAAAVFRALVEEFAMSDRQFRKLHHARSAARIRFYAGWLEMVSRSEIAAVDVATIKRLSACLKCLRAGKSWPLAIDAALVTAPL
jgi:hypothetical protein